VSDLPNYDRWRTQTPEDEEAERERAFPVEEEDDADN
jgi:hypothetical protein